MEKITLKKQDITKLIQILKEQDEVEEPNDEIYIDSEELNRLLPAIDYNLNALSKLRKFKDKKIVINGDLKLRGKPVKSLGPIIRINGNLDMVDTDIASIEGVQIAGRVTDWGSEMAKIKERRRVAGELAQAQSRREDNEWSLENADEEGLCAIAVFQFLQEEEPNEVQSEEDVDRLRQLKERRGNIYYDQEQGPTEGMGIARRIAHLTYRTETEMDVRFGRELQGDDTGRYAVESYLDHQAAKLAKRFDANTYIALSDSMSTFDIGRNRGGVASALARITAPVVVAGIDSDRLYPIRQQADLVSALPQKTELNVISSPFGHDGFLIEIDLVAPIVTKTLEKAVSFIN